eukprot:CAMPEP_0172454724 /NCGR_PEP_ID=MMETSP1065-20121228/11633_1 /TAXON_ID=265537 /ORGANISM="Amphiprora paludosa, Strain CCMP125" /LENGTH=540 /DNA_ID=CAMNT_0013207103 /DNA_START=173 /DNA_END=1798 /DNA_ORIENTATION=+
MPLSTRLIASLLLVSLETVQSTVYTHNASGTLAAYPSLPALFGAPFLEGRLYEGALQYLVENPFLCNEIDFNTTSFVDVPPLSPLPDGYRNNPNHEDPHSSSNPNDDEAIPPDEPVIEPIVLLAARGHCPFHTKAMIAESLGARVEYLLIHNHNLDGEDVLVPMYSEFGSSRLKLMAVTHRTGTALKRYIANASQHTKAQGGPLLTMDAMPPDGVMTAQDLQEVLISTLGLFFMLVSFSGCFLLCAAAAQANHRGGRGMRHTSPLWMLLMGDPDTDPVVVGDPGAAAANTNAFGGPNLLSPDEVEYYLIQQSPSPSDQDQPALEIGNNGNSTTQQPAHDEVIATIPSSSSLDAPSDSATASLGGPHQDGHDPPHHDASLTDEPSELHCAICIDDFDADTPPEEILKLPCQHLFHTHCIIPWLTERQSKCPLCKYDVYAYVQQVAAAQDQDEANDNAPQSSSQPRSSRQRPPRRRGRLPLGLSWFLGRPRPAASAFSWMAVQQSQDEQDDDDDSNPHATMGVEEFELEMAETNTAGGAVAS